MIPSGSDRSPLLEDLELALERLDSAFVWTGTWRPREAALRFEERERAVVPRLGGLGHPFLHTGKVRYAAKVAVSPRLERR